MSGRACDTVAVVAKTSVTCVEGVAFRVGIEEGRRSRGGGELLGSSGDEGRGEGGSDCGRSTRRERAGLCRRSGGDLGRVGREGDMDFGFGRAEGWFALCTVVGGVLSGEGGLIEESWGFGDGDFRGGDGGGDRHWGEE